MAVRHTEIDVEEENAYANRNKLNDRRIGKERERKRQADS